MSDVVGFEPAVQQQELAKAPVLHGLKQGKWQAARRLECQSIVDAPTDLPLCLSRPANHKLLDFALAKFGDAAVHTKVLPNTRLSLLISTGRRSIPRVGLAETVALIPPQPYASSSPDPARRVPPR